MNSQAIQFQDKVFGNWKVSQVDYYKTVKLVQSKYASFIVRVFSIIYLMEYLYSMMLWNGIIMKINTFSICKHVLGNGIPAIKGLHHICLFLHYPTYHVNVLYMKCYLIWWNNNFFLCTFISPQTLSESFQISNNMHHIQTWKYCMFTRD